MEIYNLFLILSSPSSHYFSFLNSCQFYSPDLIVWAYWNPSFQWCDSAISNAYQELSYSETSGNIFLIDH